MSKIRAKTAVKPTVDSNIVTIFREDCLKVLRSIPTNSIDLIITDPPYGIQFMGQQWDYDVPPVELWKECKRVLKPHGLIASFCGTRTYHQLVYRIEQAGFVNNVSLGWIYGSGMAKGHNIAAYAQGILTGNKCRTVKRKGMGSTNGKFKVAVRGFVSGSKDKKITDPRARKWIGWSTALKPAIEPIVIASVKPIAQSTLDQVLERHGSVFYSSKATNQDKADGILAGNNDHPTVKPTAVMNWLCTLCSNLVVHKSNRLVVLDPYMGSGSTGRAAVKQGHRFIGIDKEAKFVKIARQRIAAMLKTLATGLWSVWSPEQTMAYKRLREQTKNDSVNKRTSAKSTR